MTVRHTHRPWWPPYLAAFTLVLAGTILAAAYVAAAGPILPLHHAQVTLSAGVCSNDSIWTATLAVSADVADGTAHISDAASPWTHGVPFTHTYSIGRDIETWPVAVYVTWPDGFRSDTFNLTAHRPTSGCVPPSTTTPPTTTCEHANPPRDNCGATTLPPTTTPPTTASLCTPPPSTGPGTVVCEPSTAPTPPTSEPVTSAPAPTSPTGAGGARATTTVPLFLPVTGMSTYTVLWIGGTVFFLGVVCILISRSQARRRHLDEWGMK